MKFSESLKTFAIAALFFLAAHLTMSFIYADFRPVEADQFNVEKLASVIASSSSIDVDLKNNITNEDIALLIDMLKKESTDTPNPQLTEFLQYLIATATGLFAVFLRWLIKRWIPDFPDRSLSDYNNVDRHYSDKV